jgi:hypothetical protein
MASGQDRNGYLDDAGLAKGAGCLMARAAGGQDVVHEQDFFPPERRPGARSKSAADVFFSLGWRLRSLLRRVSNAS